MMKKNVFHAAAVMLLSVLLTPAVAQDEVHIWDGDTDSDWSTSSNWFDEATNVDPVSPPFPDAGTRVEIPVAAGNTPLIEAGDVLEAHQVRIGRSAGAGLLTMTGGSLTVSGNRFRVGSGGDGEFNMSGGTLTLDGQTFVTGSSTFGQVTITGGLIDINGGSSDLIMDEGAPGAASNLTMSAGAIEIDDVFATNGTATVNFSGGSIFSADDLRVRNDSVITMTGGIWETGDKLEFGDVDNVIDGGSMFINGGTMRAKRLGDFVAGSVAEINGDGVLQFLTEEESVSDAVGYINGGLFTTSESNPLGVTLVDVSGVSYTQISVVPEPSALVLGGMCGLAMCWRRRNGK